MTGSVHEEALAFCGDRYDRVAVKTALEMGRASKHGGLIRLDVLDGVVMGVLAEEASRYMHWLIAENEGSAKRLLALLPDDRPLGFVGLQSNLRPLVVERFRTVDWETSCVVYALPMGVYVPEPTIEIRPLREVDALQVAFYWPHGAEVGYIRHQIRTQPSFAVFEDNRPIAYALLHEDGAMGFLHTMEFARGRGLARQISYAIINELRRRGITPYCYVLTGNAPSRSLCESLGMIAAYECSWIGLDPRCGENA